LVVFLGGTAEDKDVVYIGETEIQFFEDLIHETLEGLGGVSQAKGLKRDFEKAKRRNNGCLLDVVRMDGNLVVSPHEVDFGKGGAARKAVRVVLYVCDWVPVRNGANIQGSVISAGPTTAVLGHEVEGGRPWALGASGCTVLQHGVDLGLGDGQTFRVKAAGAAGYWRPGRCSNVMRRVVPHLAMAPCGLHQFRESLQEAVRGRAFHHYFYTGDGRRYVEAWCGQ
jgi:hypothetical protein